MNDQWRWFDAIFLVLFGYLFVLQIQAIWPFTVDDMYISLRYAKNWAAGTGLLWNAHEPPVEGYSNFSFVVLAAFTLLFQGNPVFVLKIAGVIGLFFTCYFLYLIARFWFPKRVALLPGLGLLCYKGQIIWATSGLETTVYEALVCGTVYYCFRGMGYSFFPHKQRGAAQNAFFIAAGFLLALAGLTRPEAPALMIVFFLLICWDRPKLNTSSYWQAVFYFCATLVLIYLPYFCWRIFYFHHLFPNPVYCKGLLQGFTFSLDATYLRLIAPLIFFVLPACVAAQDKRVYFLCLPSVAYLLMLADSDPVVAFENRLFLPAFVLLLPLVLQGIYLVVCRYWKQKDNLLYFFCYLIFTLVIFCFIPSMSLASYRYYSQYPVRGEQLRANVLEWLKVHIGEGNTVVLGDSGMIPYYSNLNFIDSYCLNNLTMAHYSSAHRYEQFCKEVMHSNPDVIILTSLVEQGKVTYAPSDQCLKTMLDKQNAYQMAASFTAYNRESNYRYELFTLEPHPHSPRR